MTCYRPILGYRDTSGRLTMARGPMSTGQLMEVSCGRCVGCHLAKSKEWMVRCVHEDRMHPIPGSFVTLTFNDEHLPPTVSRRTHQKFIRALRDRLRPKGYENIRYFMSGEYGADEYVDYQKPDGQFGKFRLGPGRPHYHYLIFGYDFPDKIFWKEHRGHTYYRSAELEKVWTDKNGNSMGFSTIGHITPETAAYTARYVLKKSANLNRDADHYVRYLPGFEEGIQIEPEFCLMSLKPGIGQRWFEKYGVTDIYDSGDFVVISGKKYATPKYYDKLYEDLDERELFSIKTQRRRDAALRSEHSTPNRLATREELSIIRSQKLKRGLESETKYV